MIPLSSPQKILSSYPCSTQASVKISQSRFEIEQIISGKDPRLLLIVGPCSIHDLKSAREYAKNLKELSKNVEDCFLLVMRCYFEKARSLGSWKGFAYDPHLDNSCDMETAFKEIRLFFLELAEIGLPTAMEFLDPNLPPYFQDLISWGSIGARTSSSQTHRQMASSLPMPVGFKNTIDGNINIAIDAAEVAAMPHSYPAINQAGQLSQIHSKGNLYSHIILRGSLLKPNYNKESIHSTISALEKRKLNSNLIIDCSHGNSRKDASSQSTVFQSVLQERLSPNPHIIGMMLESYLYGGKQNLTPPIEELAYGVSITDSCIDWEDTEILINKAAQKFTPSCQLKTSTY